MSEERPPKRFMRGQIVRHLISRERFLILDEYYKEQQSYSCWFYTCRGYVKPGRRDNIMGRETGGLDAYPLYYLEEIELVKE